MVELVIVIILIGILGTIAVGRFFERSSFDTAAWTEQVRSTLRYAQKIAIAQNTPVYVHLTTARIAVCLASDAACASADARLTAPGGANSGSAATRAACGSGSWMCEAPPAGVKMNLPGQSGAAIGSLSFDGLGRATLIGAFAGKLEIKGDGLTQVVGVDAETGYVD
jgi:MSHA pilin protein MshC